MVLSNVTKLQAAKPGPVLAVFAGVHGDERAGILALHELKRELHITKGTVYLVLANPPAVNKNVRLVNKNINRCFNADNKGRSYEDRRARELMKLLDACDALIDLHAYKNPEGEAFVICEESSLPVASKLDPGIISTNWTAVEPGAADGYMHLSGKVGICVECGPIEESKHYKALAKKSVLQFLQHYGVIADTVAFSKSPKKIIKAERAVIRKHDDFYLNPKLYNFEQLVDDQVVGHQNNQEIVAQKGDYIMFPDPNAQINAEAFIIGKALDTVGSRPLTP